MKYLAIMFLLVVNILTYMANKKDPKHDPILGGTAYKQFKMYQGK